MKVQPYRPHLIHQNSHINTRINNLSLMTQSRSSGWDFHVPPDHRMVDPNLSSPIHPCAIFQAWMWDLIEHINKNSSMASKGYQLNPSNNDSTSQSDITKPLSEWSHSKPSRTRKSLFNQGSETASSTQDTGLERVCPTKAPGLVTQPTKGSRSFVQWRLRD